jgi:hypothetical protein
VIASADEFRELRTSEDRDQYLRAAHDEAPLSVWNDVITRFPDMRMWVAHNKTVPVEILEVLAGDLNGQVRYTVAMKRKLPESLQLRLAADPDESVRLAIAHNAKATRAALQLLADDSWEPVRDHARARLARFDNELR